MTWQEERRKVAANMVAYGGSFVKRLGFALMVADKDNTKKIKAVFPDYWNKYLHF